MSKTINDTINRKSMINTHTVMLTVFVVVVVLS